MFSKSKITINFNGKKVFTRTTSITELLILMYFPLKNDKNNIFNQLNKLSNVVSRSDTVS